MKSKTKLHQHIGALEEKHRKLDEQIAALGDFPDTAKTKFLKRKKLQLKEEILKQRRLLESSEEISTIAAE